MRFPIAALFFMVASFIFFIIWAVGSMILEEVSNALSPTAPIQASNMFTLLQTGFGYIAVLFFIVGIILVFVLDSTADEPEMYWRER